MYNLHVTVFVLTACVFSSGWCSSSTRECHTCNSVDIQGCDKDHFHPVQGTTEEKSCTNSFQATVANVQKHFFASYHNFPTNQFSISNNSKEACLKFTLLSHDHNDKVTYRGCSMLGMHSCDIIKSVSTLVNATVVHCDGCQDRNLCNHASSLAASLLLAAVALFTAHKF